MADLRRINLKVLMVKKRLTQKELAEKSGVQRYRISDIVRGCGYPRDHERKAIAEALGNNADDKNLFLAE